MPLFDLAMGAASGIGIQLWANALTRQRHFARPWNHASCAIIGGYIGYNYTAWEKQLLDLINEKRVLKGLIPIKREEATVGGLHKTW